MYFASAAVASSLGKYSGTGAKWPVAGPFKISPVGVRPIASRRSEG